VNDREAFLTKAKALLADESYGAAVLLAQERLRLLPGDIDAGLMLCRAFLGTGELDEARRILAECGGFFSDAATVFAAMGAHCRQKGFVAEAVSYCRRCLALDPDNARAQELTLFLDEEAFREPLSGGTEDHYDEVTDLAEDFRTLTLVELYIRQGHFDMAAHVLKEIVAREGTNEKAAELLRCIQEKRGSNRPAQKATVMAELQRWMKNIERIRIHAR
jgi:tetratricopeptide (TPR) repeat protein